MISARLLQRLCPRGALKCEDMLDLQTRSPCRMSPDPRECCGRTAGCKATLPTGSNSSRCRTCLRRQTARLRRRLRVCAARKGHPYTRDERFGNRACAGLEGDVAQHGRRRQEVQPCVRLRQRRQVLLVEAHCRPWVLLHLAALHPVVCRHHVLHLRAATTHRLDPASAPSGTA